LLGFEVIKSSKTKLIKSKCDLFNQFIIYYYDGSSGELRLALKFISQYTPHKVILVSSNYIDSDERLLVSAGARGYINLLDPVSKILENLNRVLRGELAFNKLTLSQTLMEILPERKNQHANSTSFNNMTAKELQVVGLIYEGLQNKEIAIKLNISPATVKTHVQRILKKAGVRNRTQIVARAAQSF